jgi:hypothetical protein
MFLYLFFARRIIWPVTTGVSASCSCRTLPTSLPLILTLSSLVCCSFLLSLYFCSFAHFALFRAFRIFRTFRTFRTFDPSTFRPFDLSTFRPFDLSPFLPFSLLPSYKFTKKGNHEYFDNTADEAIYRGWFRGQVPLGQSSGSPDPVMWHSYDIDVKLHLIGVSFIYYEGGRRRERL